MPENEELFSRLQNKMKSFLRNGFVQLKNAVMDNSVPANMVDDDDDDVHPRNNRVVVAPIPIQQDIAELPIQQNQDGAWDANDNEEQEDPINADVELHNDEIVDNLPSIVEDRVPSVVVDRGHPADNLLNNHNVENGRTGVANTLQGVAEDVQQALPIRNTGINDADTRVEQRQPVVAGSIVERVYKNSFIMNQQRANLYFQVDNIVNCKSSRNKNGTNAVVGLFALAGFKLGVSEAMKAFKGQQSFLTMEPRNIKGSYNRLLKNIGLKLVANKPEWEIVFPKTKDNAIIVLIFFVKEIHGGYSHNRVALYDSVSNILIPFNTHGTALFIGNTVHAAASAHDPVPIKATLGRHLYPHVSSIQLTGVYKLYKKVRAT